MVEIWPYAERSHGIAFFQLFGRLAGFFTTFVNPIGLENAGWKYLISYCCFLAYEIVFVYFMFPETFGRTLEELAFRKCRPPNHAGRYRRRNTLTCFAPQCLRTRRWLNRLLMLSRRWSAITMKSRLSQESLLMWRLRSLTSRVREHMIGLATTIALPYGDGS